MAHTGSSSTEASSTEASSPSASNNNNHSNHNHQNTNSISYLAPFVASVLRDQVLTDSIAELKREREDRLRLAFTGPGGRPVYFEASMRDGVNVTRPDGIPLWKVIFEDNDDHNTSTIIPNFVATVAGLEIRLGDIVMTNFNQMECYTAPAGDAGFDRTRDDKPQMINVGFNNGNGVHVRGRVGPILYEDYINLRRHLLTYQVTELVRLMKNHQTNNNNETVLLPQLQILSVLFIKSQIKGILPLLEDTTGGLSTSK